MVRTIKADESVLGRAKTKWECRFQEFVVTGEKVRELVYDPGDYASPTVLRSVAHVAAKKSIYPVTVRIRKDRVFLVRTDM